MRAFPEVFLRVNLLTRNDRGPNRLNVQAAVNAPRIHHQWLPDELRIEEGISPDTIRLLEALGHTVNEKPQWVPFRVS